MYLPPRLIPALLASVIIVAACDRSPTATDSSARPDSPRFATNVSTVCISAAEPTGYVVLSYFSTFSCPYSGTYDNAKSIGLPASPETVCESSYVPDGWVITAFPSFSSSCDRYNNSSGTTRNTMTIKIPGSSETVCNSSPIPSNYSITSSTYLSACDKYNEGYRGWNNARRISRV